MGGLPQRPLLIRSHPGPRRLLLLCHLVPGLSSSFFSSSSWLSEYNEYSVHIKVYIHTRYKAVFIIGKMILLNRFGLDRKTQYV